MRDKGLPLNLDAIKLLYDYNYAAHKQVWQCVIKLDEDTYMQPLDYSVGSIHEQVVHTMSAEHAWFSRLNGGAPERLWNGSDFKNRDEVRAKWDEVEQMIRGYINQLDDNKLASTISYPTTSGEEQSTPIIGILMHVVNHGTDHRAQTLAMIDKLGGETLAQDLIFYLRGRWD